MRKFAIFPMRISAIHFKNWAPGLRAFPKKKKSHLLEKCINNRQNYRKNNVTSPMSNLTVALIFLSVHSKQKI
jgi:hypothetical protein